MPESSKQRQANAIGTAKECLRKSESAFVRVGAHAATAYALQGILRLQIEAMPEAILPEVFGGS